MPKTAGKASTGKASKTSKKTSTKSSAKKVTVSLTPELIEDIGHYLSIYGYSKEDFVLEAINEKINRDKISHMIDSMVQL